MTTNAHPICLLARTETDVTALFYCFYVITYTQGEYKVTIRIPEYRDQMLDTVQVFIPYNSKRFTGSSEAFGVSTITISDGTRYYAYWKGYKDRVFIGYSKIFFTSFARNVFDLLNYEKADELRNTLHCLCEFPIQPAAGLAYDIVLRGGIATVSFSSVEQADDEDMSLVSMRFLTPSMLVTCWEAIMLERNILVIGTDEAVVAFCCEFLRKLSLPLNYCNIYIPQLLPELMEVVKESPIPYIIGVSVETLKLEGIKLENIDAVILDINSGQVNSTKLYSDPNVVRAPTVLMQRLINKVTSAYNNPTLTHFFNRPSYHNPNIISSFSAEIINQQADKVISIFSAVNLALLSARACTSKGLYRRPQVKVGNGLPDIEYDHIPMRQINKQASRIVPGFTKNLDHMIGLMNMLRDADDAEDKPPLHQVWVEMDSANFCIYEHADDLPFIVIAIKDIESVYPSPTEPEGQVFDLVSQQTTYRFITQETEWRVKWLEAIEETIKTHGNKEEEAYGGGPSSPTANNINSANSTKSADSLDTEPSILEFVDEAQDIALTKFRALFMRTQMVSFLSSTTENNGYESFLKSAGSNLLAAMANFSKEKSTISILSHSGLTLELLLDNISKMKSPKEFIDDSIKADKRRRDLREEKKAKRRQAQAGGGGSGGQAIGGKEKDKGSILTSPQNKGGSSNSINSSSSSSNSSGNSSSQSSKELSSNSINPSNRSINNESLTPSNREGDAAAGENKGFLKSIKNFLGREGGGGDESEFVGDGEYSMSTPQPEDEHTMRIIDKNTEEEYKKYENQNTYIREVIKSFKNCDAALNKHMVMQRMKLVAKVVHRYNEGRKANRIVESIRVDIVTMNSELTAAIDKIKGGCPGRTPLHIGSENSAVYGSSELEKFAGSDNLTPDGMLIRDIEAKKEQESPSLWFDCMWALFGINYYGESEEVVVPNPAASTAPSPIKPKKTWQIQEEYNSYNSMMREIFVRLMMNQREMSKANGDREHIVDIINGIIGHVYCDLKDIDKCFEYFSLGFNLNNQSNVMKLLVEKLSSAMEEMSSQHHQQNVPVQTISTSLHSIERISSILRFLAWGNKHGRIIGLQAYKLVLSILNQINVVTLNDMNKALDERDVLSPKHRKALNNASKGFELRKASQYLSEMHTSANRRGVFSAPTKDFLYHFNPNTSDILNEMWICDKMVIPANPCELSITLLQQLREILKNHCKTRPSMNLTDASSKVTQNMIAVPINVGLFDDLLQSSAMRRFYIQCSKFQKVDLSELSQDQLVLFFGNVYNIITVHSLIVNNQKNAPGNNNLDRSAFMKSSQYNISGSTYSLMDIEHCILRNASTIPMVLGPLTHLVSFDIRDPRRKYLILDPRPEITFVLFTASVSSPSLQVLRDAENINVEMKKYARQYFTNHITVDMDTKTIQLPGLVYQFWADFGGSDPKLLRTNGLRAITKLMNGGPEKIYNDLCHICRDKATLKQLKMNFTQVDWTAAILIDK